MESNYYVYAYLDENLIPFYIGMGRRDRITQHLLKRNYKDKDHLFFYAKLNKIISKSKKFYYKKLRINLTRNEAFSIEQVLIEHIGRRDLKMGPLTNLTNGGEGALGARNDAQHIAIYDIESLCLVKIFKSIALCSEFIGVKESTVRIAERRCDRTGNPTKYYVLRFNTTPLLFFLNKKKDRTFDNNKSKVIAINVNGDRIRFDSVTKCSLHFNIKRERLNYIIKRNKQYNNWIFIYDK